MTAAAGIGRPLRKGYKLNGVVIASVVIGSGEELKMPVDLPPPEVPRVIDMNSEEGRRLALRSTPEPTPAEMAKNIAVAAARWISAGLPVVSQAVYDDRSEACDACQLWNAKGNFGLGKCMAPDCGCTRFKRWLSTEVCKHPQGSRWPLLKRPNSTP